MSVVFVVDPSDAGVAAALTRVGVEVRAVIDLETAVAGSPPEGTDAVVFGVGRRTSVPTALVRVCDRAGVVLVVVGRADHARRAAAGHGLSWADVGDPWALAAAFGGNAPVAGPGATDAAPAEIVSRRGSLVTVWGPAGSPGRSSVATLLAWELARGGSSAMLVDADTHAPSLAIALGLPDEGAGFATVCRAVATEGATLDIEHLAQPVPHPDGTLTFLCGINRPARWIELAHDRVTAALEAGREVAAHTVVDTSASLEADEELVSDIDGPRRNQAARAAVEAADVVVAVIAADPVGIARGVRGLAELRALRGARPVITIVNKLRPGPLGIDARGQVRRALDELAGVRDPWFLPWDPRALDAALLRCEPPARVAARSTLVLAARRIVGDGIIPALGTLAPAGVAASQPDPAEAFA